MKQTKASTRLLNPGDVSLTREMTLILISDTPRMILECDKQDLYV